MNTINHFYTNINMDSVKTLIDCIQKYEINLIDKIKWYVIPKTKYKLGDDLMILIKNKNSKIVPLEILIINVEWNKEFNICYTVKYKDFNHYTLTFYEDELINRIVC